MRIIISPAKKMRVERDCFLPESVPVFIEDTKRIAKELQAMDLPSAKALWQCSDKLAEENFRRFHDMDLERELTPALVSYEGIQYQYMSPMTFEQGDWDYAAEHLRILSGFYGVLRPFDGVTPYRLEMQAKLKMGECRDLYEFWGSRLYESLIREEREPVIVNLASKEYSKCVEDYLDGAVRFVTCVFGEKRDGKVRQKATQAKMARGEMVRFLAQNRVEDPEEMKAFDRLGFSYSPEDSGLDEKGREVYAFLL